MAVPLTGTIAQYPDGQYPTHNAATGADGYRCVADYTARNAIPAYYRVQGMAVFTQADGNLYTLNAAPWTNTNSDWTLFSGGNSNGGLSTRDFVFAIPNSTNPIAGTNLPGYYLTCTHNGAFSNWYTSAVNAPTGNSVIFDVQKQNAGSGNFASIFTNVNSQPSVGLNATTGNGTAFATNTFNAGDRLRFDLTQADGANAAQGLTLTLGTTITS